MPQHSEAVAPSGSIATPPQPTLGPSQPVGEPRPFLPREELGHIAPARVMAPTCLALTRSAMRRTFRPFSGGSQVSG